MQAREALAAHCRSELGSLHTAVHVPESGHVVDLSAGAAAFRHAAPRLKHSPILYNRPRGPICLMALVGRPQVSIAG